MKNSISYAALIVALSAGVANAQTPLVLIMAHMCLKYIDWSNSGRCNQHHDGVLIQASNGWPHLALQCSGSAGWLVSFVKWKLFLGYQHQ